ncbi:MAG: hypothetical protein AABZ15_12995 [Nitrospirota bacterium]
MRNYYLKVMNLVKEYWIYIFAVASEASALLVNFSLFALIQHHYGPEQLSLYMIIRRTISMFLPAVMLGVQISLIKHIGAITDQRKIISYIWFGITLPLTLALAMLMTGAAAPDLLSRIFLGNQKYSAYMVPLLFLVLSTALAQAVVAISKGLHRIFLASLIYVIFFSLGPLCAYFLSSSLSGFLSVYAFMLLTGGIAILLHFMTSFENKAPVLKGHVEFITFGIKGAGSDFLMMFLLWLPPYIMASTNAITMSGYFSLIMSLVLVSASPLSPIGSAMMPKVARALQTNSGAELRTLFTKLAKLFLLIAIPAFLASLMLFGTVAKYLLHDGLALGNRAAAMMLTTSVPVSAYFGLRNVLDVGYSPLRNFYNIFIALAVFLSCFFSLLFFISPVLIRIANVVAFTAAMWTLGVLTVYYSYVLYRRTA